MLLTYFAEYDDRSSRTRPQHASPTALHAWAAAYVPAGQHFYAETFDLCGIAYYSLFQQYMYFFEKYAPQTFYTVWSNLLKYAVYTKSVFSTL